MDLDGMGARIEASIKQRGFLRFDFAKRLGVLVSTLYEICRCRRLPTMEVFLKLLDLLNVSADFLLGIPPLMDGGEENASF